MTDGAPRGVICDVKRFAVHDGPGIRTTLFLKGCPLRCLWCHNPESQSPRPQVALRRHKCRSCGDCAELCGNHRIVEGIHRFDRDRCTACGRCVDGCLFDALKLYGRSLTVPEAVGLLLEDVPFYETSGGGVTLSGGEPLVQPAFCAELLAGLKGRGIRTAVDTCGAVPWRAFEEVLPYADLFLFDFKHADPERHAELTGRDNVEILANLGRLVRLGKAVEIRMPMIPGANMDEENLRRSAELLSALGGSLPVRLLPYHSLARSKYESLGMADTMPRVDSPSETEMARAALLLRRVGLTVLDP